MEHRPKIAILTHFNSFQDGYALAVGWRERALLLDYYGQDFDFLVNEKAAPGLYPHQLSCLTSISKDEPFEKRVRHYRKLYREVLEPYDIILTADLIYQSKGNFLAWNQAAKWVNEDFKARGLKKRWYHWIHSAFNHRKKNAAYPESLRYEPMDDATIVYMNESEKWGAAAQYGLPTEAVACVYNPKDPRSFHNFHPYAWEVTKVLDIANKDFVQVFPFCTTRADAKGVREVIHVAAAIKRAGKKVGLVLANANARRMGFEIAKKDKLCQDLGLVKYDPKKPVQDADYVWTSDIVDRKGPLPRPAVADLFLVSNYFSFGSWREVCPNVLLEAKITGNYLVVNQNTAPSVEFAGEGASYFHSPSKRPGVPDGRGDMIRGTQARMTPQDWDRVAADIIEHAPSRAHIWEFSFERIWENQLKPLLYPQKGGSQ